jgi:hypothetical protein
VLLVVRSVVYVELGGNCSRKKAIHRAYSTASDDPEAGKVKIEKRKRQIDYFVKDGLLRWSILLSKIACDRERKLG